MTFIPSDPRRFQQAIDLIDAANAQDPRRTIVDGHEVPNELLYAQRMTRQLDLLQPDASEALRLAVRCQHVCRWKVPRATYPMTRPGYHQWREYLYRFHADTAATILRDAGYDDAMIGRVQSLVRKERLKSDPETQSLEDVACLVFLEYELADFAAKHADDESKILGILRRTWKKMSSRGQEAAMGITLSEGAKRLVEKATSS